MIENIKGFWVQYDVVSKMTGMRASRHFVGPYLKKTEAQYWAKVFGQIAVMGSVKIEEKEVVFPKSLYGDRPGTIEKGNTN